MKNILVFDVKMMMLCWRVMHKITQSMPLSLKCVFNMYEFLVFCSNTAEGRYTLNAPKISKAWKRGNFAPPLSLLWDCICFRKLPEMVVFSQK